MSEEAAKHPTIDGHRQIIKLTIDGMGRAKFRTPRNIAQSKEFENLWRPQLHVSGVIAWGHIELYVIMPPNVAKDSERI